MPKRQKRNAAGRSLTLHGAFCAVTVFLLALGLRWAYVESVANSPGARFLQTNPARYHAWAEAILQGKAPSPPFDQPPAYAYMLAILYAAGGSDPQFVRRFQAILDALQCTLLALLAHGVGGAAHAWAVGLLAAAYGPFIYFAGELVPATLPLALLGAAALASQFRRPLLAAVLWALATLLRAELLLGALIHAVLLMWSGGRAAAKTLLLTLLATWLTATLAVSLTTGRPVPYTTGFGLNFWLGNNPHADGTNPFPPRPARAAIARAIERYGSDAVAIDTWFFFEAVEFWKAHPSAAARLLWKKFRWTLVNRELPNTSDIDWQQSYSWLFRLRGFPASWGAVLCLAAVGLSCPRRWLLRNAGASALLAAALTSVVVCIVFFTHARMRLPITPLLLLLAAQPFVASLNVRSMQQLRPRLLVAAGLGAVAAWFAFSNPYGVRNYRIPALDTNAGVAERLAGNLDKAVVLLSRALAADREDDIAWVHLALAREELGDFAGAAEAYLDGLANAPHSTDLASACAAFAERHPLPIDKFSLCQAKTGERRESLRRQLRSWYRVPQRTSTLTPTP